MGTQSASKRSAKFRNSALADLMFYYGYKATRVFLRILPKYIVSVLSFCIARIIYFLNRTHRKIIFKNLDFFLSTSDYDKRKIAKLLYLRFTRYLFDMLGSEFRDPEKLRKIVKIENDGKIKESIAKNEKIIMISAHYGYWELIGQSLSAFYRPFLTVAQTLNNSKRLTDELNNYRKMYNMEVVNKNGAMRSVASALKNGKIVGFLTDQSPKSGVMVIFFNREIIWYESASRLAKQFDAVIYPTFITTKDFRIYTLFFLEPIRPDPSLDKDEDIKRMAQLEAQSLEEAIRRDPSEYFWFHKRMKRQIKHFYT
jgi:KDO2-lipid IV(A) lauroyltransferase